MLAVSQGGSPEGPGLEPGTVVLAGVAAQNGSHGRALGRWSDQHLMVLALHFLEHGAHMGAQDMALALKAIGERHGPPSSTWRPQLLSAYGTENRTGSRVGLHAHLKRDTQRQQQTQQQTLADGNAALCAKKQVVVRKFDAILDRLKSEQNALQSELATVGAA